VPRIARFDRRECQTLLVYIELGIAASRGRAGTLQRLASQVVSKGKLMDTTQRRTIVISDAHGYPAFIENALAHAGFDPGLDRLIFAGDFLDRGSDPEGCLDLIEQHADTILFGNHEVELMIGAPIEFGTASELFEEPLVERFREQPDRWRFAVAVGDVLITHAGLSTEYLDSLGREVSAGAHELADAIERQARFEIGVILGIGVADYDGVLGQMGPLWFRPHRRFLSELPTGLVQVVGHTPPELAEGDLAGYGFHLVDPFAYSGPPSGNRCRYGIIHDEGVRVVSDRDE
jgi:predicted phosphodiesterase